MGRKIILLLLSFILIFSLFLMSGCIFKSGYPSGPVKWSMVSGDGTWNSSSRKWTVAFAPGDTKTATIKMDNTGSQTLWVLVVESGAPDYIIFHLEGDWSPPSDNVLKILPGGSAEFTISGTAGTITPRGQHNYVVNFGWSTNEDKF
jgi:hypothetical protein